MPNQSPWSIHYAMRYAVLPGASKKGTAEQAPTVLCVVACEFLGEIPRFGLIIE
jgi:geranylgeranyl diphosphate synthase type II